MIIILRKGGEMEMAWEMGNISIADINRMISRLQGNENTALFADIVNEIINRQNTPANIRKIHSDELIFELERIIRGFVGRASNIEFSEYLLHRAKENAVKISKERVAELSNDLFKNLSAD